jgi:hypothetical protein
MKKLLLIAWLTGIAAFYGYSQMSLSLSDSTGSVRNDSTIIRSGLPSDLEITSYIFIKNNKAADIQVKCKKVEMSLIQGTANYFCWGLCYGSNVYISPNPVTIAAGINNTLDFSGHYSPHDSIGESIIRYVFFDMNNPSDTVCFNVKYVTVHVGVNDISAVKENTVRLYPNPVNGTANFEYNVPAGTNAGIVIRDILGSVVREIPVSMASGKVTISTSDLPAGVYFYSLMEEGRPVTTGKLIVRH